MKIPDIEDQIDVFIVKNITRDIDGAGEMLINLDNHICECIIDMQAPCFEVVTKFNSSCFYGKKKRIDYRAVLQTDDGFIKKNGFTFVNYSVELV
jgi:hypothetical protein